MLVADGNTSLEDWLLLTSSLGCKNLFLSSNLPPFNTCALFAITSFIFILVCVPDPVCQITSGKCSSNLPCKISSHTAIINSAFWLDNKPKDILALAQAFFIYANASITSLGISWSPILKLLLLRSVWAPQYLSAATFNSPIVSFSIRKLFFFIFLYLLNYTSKIKKKF